MGCFFPKQYRRNIEGENDAMLLQPIKDGGEEKRSSQWVSMHANMETVSLE